ncbi:MAG: hypothetical protein H7Y04_06595 [Verrucomicrobia bacterium]|nr:hypothetical protein [Cytophagales bacterium]
MKFASTLIILFIFLIGVQAQTDTSKGTFWKPNPRNYNVKHALEVESLVPMFFYGGYHFAVGYRYKKFRVRLSVINGGTYDAETAGFNTTGGFKRYYQTSPGIFIGYNVWKNLEIYTYLESHTFKIEQKSTGIKKDIGSFDTGLAVSYQFFIGRYFYIQPGLHLYLRTNKTVDFPDKQYHIPNADGSVVVRLGARLWKQY